MSVTIFTRTYIIMAASNKNYRSVFPWLPNFTVTVGPTRVGFQMTTTVIHLHNLRASPILKPGPSLIRVKKGKDSFYIAQYPVRWTAQSASHVLPTLTDLFIPTLFSASPGSILTRQQLRAETKSLTFPPLSIARYSFIQLSQQGRQWSEIKCPIF